MSVIHIKDAPSGWQSDPTYVYIGRPRKGLDGQFGNPFVLKDESERAKVLKSYTYWLVGQLSNLNFAWEVKLLANKTLVCFCAPKPCHGDILWNIAVLLNQYV